MQAKRRVIGPMAGALPGGPPPVRPPLPSGSSTLHVVPENRPRSAQEPDRIPLQRAPTRASRASYGSMDDQELESPLHGKEGGHHRLSSSEGHPPGPPANRRYSQAALKGLCPGSRKVVQHFVSSITRHRWDDMLRTRLMMMAANASLGIILGIVLLQVAWNGQDYKQMWEENVTRLVMFFSTCILIYQHVDYEGLVIQTRAKHINGPTASRVSASNKSKWTCGRELSIFETLRKRISPFSGAFWLQLILYSIHPLPDFGLFTKLLPPNGTSNPSAPTINPDNADFVQFWDVRAMYGEAREVTILLMCSRIWILLKLLRDQSFIYKFRHVIQENKFRVHGLPKFDIWLTLKTYCYHWPVTYATVGLSCLISVHGYWIYVFERRWGEQGFTFRSGLWIAANSVLIGWPADVFSATSPESGWARIIAMVGSASGLIFTAFFIGCFCEKMIPSRLEKEAVTWALWSRLVREEKAIAASLIQYVWRAHRHDMQMKHVFYAPEYDVVQAKGEAEWDKVVGKKGGHLRSIRMERVNLEQQAVEGGWDLGFHAAISGGVIGMDPDVAMQRFGTPNQGGPVHRGNEDTKSTDALTTLTSRVEHVEHSLEEVHSKLDAILRRLNST